MRVVNRLIFYFTLFISPLCAETWNLSGGGLWLIPGNWSPASAPNSIGAVGNLFGAITSPSVISLDNNVTIGTLAINSGFAYTIDRSGLFSLTLQSGGAVAITVSNSNGNGAHQITVPIILGSGPLTITQNSTGTLNLSGAISQVGSIGITKAGAQTARFSGTSANTYTGVTNVMAGTLELAKTAGVNAVGPTVTISGGTLRLINSNQIPNTASVSHTSGTFNLNNQNDRISNYTFTGGTYTGGSGLLSLQSTGTALTMGAVNVNGDIALVSGSGGGITYNGAAPGGGSLLGVDLGGIVRTLNFGGTSTFVTSINGVVSGTGGITKTGTSILRLGGSANNTYTGATTLNAGTFLLDKSAGLVAAPGSVDINNAAATLRIGTIEQTIGSLIVNAGTITFDGAAALNLNTAVTTALTLATGATIGGQINITGAANGAVTKTGVTTATLAGLSVGGVTRLFNVTGTLDITGVLSGMGGVTQNSGAGTLIFSGGASNTLTGTTTANSGTLSLDKMAGLVASAGGVVLNAGGTVSLSATADQTIGSFTYNGGTLIFPGGRSLNLSTSSGAALTLNGALNISQPLNLTGSAGGGGVTQTFAGTNTLNNLNLGGFDRVFNTSVGANLEVSGIISGTGGITKTIGTGTATFSGAGANTYSGLTTVSAGMLTLSKTAGVTAIPGDMTISGGNVQLINANQIANTSTVTETSGSFDLNGNDETISSFVFDGGTLTQGIGILSLSSTGTALSMQSTTIPGQLNLIGGSGGNILFTGASGTATLTDVDLGGVARLINVNNGSAAIDMAITGVISGAAGLNKTTGVGTLQFNGAGANTYSGLTTVSTGTLELAKTAGITALPGDVAISGGTVQLINANQIANTSTLTETSGTFDLNGNDETIASFIFNGGTFTQGGGVLTLAGTGTALSMQSTTIPGQVNLIGGSGGDVLFTGASGTATLTNLDLGGVTRLINVNNGSAATDMEITGVISGAAGLNKTTGMGALRFSGAGANTYSGLTTVSTGTLELAKTAGVVSLPGDMAVSGGTVQLINANQIANTSTVTETSGAFALNGNDETIATFVFNGGTFTQGVGILSLASTGTALSMQSTTIPGQVNLIGGSGGDVLFTGASGTATLTNLDLGAITRVFDINNGSAAIDMAVSGIVSGTGGLTKSTGLGSLRLSGAASNTYSGLTTVSDGVLELAKTGAAIAIPGDAAINDGIVRLISANQIADTSIVTLNAGTGSLDLNNFSETFSQLNFNGGSVDNTSILNLASNATALNMSVNGTIGGQVNLTGGGGGGLVNFTGGGVGTLNNLNTGAFDRTITVSSGTLSIGGILSGTAGIDKQGVAILALTGGASNTITGDVSLNAGTLSLDKSSSFIALTGGVILNNAAATLQVGAVAQTINDLVYNAGMLVIPGGSALNLADSTGDALTLATGATITGQLNLTGGSSGGNILQSAAATATLTNLDLGGFTRSFDIIALGTHVISGLLSGTGGVTKDNGLGTMRYSGATPNTYGGLTTVSSGLLELAKTAGVTAIPGNIAINDGTVQLINANQIADTSIVTLNSGTGTFDLNSNDEAISQLNYNGGSVVNIATLDLTSNTTALNLAVNSSLGGQINLTGGSGGGLVNFSGGGTGGLNNLDLGAFSRGVSVTAGTLDIAGVLSGAGGISTGGAGTLELSGAANNTVTGPITTQGGTLFINKNAGIVATAGPVQINATGAVVTAGVDQTIGSLVFNAGTLTQGAALNLTASSGAALTMRNTTIPGQINLTGASNGGIVFDPINGGTATITSIDLGTPVRTVDVPSVGGMTVGMVILGSTSAAGGGFDKQSGGILRLQGVHTYPGGSSVTVTGGRLRVDGDLTCATLPVLAGGTLLGTGTITGDVTVQGTISPGASIGTLTLIGDQVFASGSTTVIEFNPTMSDLIDITGALTIQPGSTLSIMPAMGTYPPNFSYVIIQTTGGVTGTYTNVINSLPLFMSTVVYTPTEVLLQNAVMPFSPDVTPGTNAAAVAACLDTTTPVPDSDLALVYANLQAIPTMEGLINALNQMQPSMLKGLALVAENNAFSVGSALFQRMWQVYDERCCCSGTPITVWGSVAGDYLGQDRQGQNAGFRAPSLQFIGGADRRWSPRLLAGLSGGYTTSHLNWQSHLGNGNLHTGFGGGYATFLGRRFFCSGALFGGVNVYQGRRFIEFEQINRTASSRFIGGQVSGHFDVGYTLGKGCYEGTPYVAINPLYLRQPSFTETGANSLNVHTESSNYLVVRSEAGIRASRTFAACRGQIQLNGQVAYAREDRILGDVYLAQLTSIPDCTMRVTGLSPNRNLVVPALQLGYCSCGGGFSVSIRYQAEVGRHFWGHNGAFQFTRTL